MLILLLCISVDNSVLVCVIFKLCVFLFFVGVRMFRFCCWMCRCSVFLGWFWFFFGCSVRWFWMVWFGLFLWVSSIFRVLLLLGV